MKKSIFLVGILLAVMTLACGQSTSVREVPATMAPAREPARAARTATATLEIPVTGSRDEPLQLENLNSIPPEDVIRNMFVYGAGGGPGECLEPLENNTRLEARQPDVILLQYCWEDLDSSVELTVASPDRMQEVFDLPVRDGSGFRYIDGFYQVDLTRRAGNYSFYLKGAQHSLKFSVNFSPPKLPVVYQVYPPGSSWEYGVIGPRHRLHLAGFAPNEALRLLVYRHDYSENKIAFMGWQDLAAGKDGQAWVDTDFKVSPDDALGLTVVGSASGEVRLLQQADSLDSFMGFTTTCPGTLPSRLEGEQTVQAARDTFVYQGIFTAPSAVERLDADARIQVFSGPWCIENTLWWSVDDTNYVMEAAGQQYFLEPAP